MILIYLSICMLSKCFAQENSANREELNLVAQPMMVGGAMGSGVATSTVVFPGPIQPLLPATKPTKKLDDECTSNEECKTAFAECRDQKCKCQSGFTADGQNCRPTEYNCPYGDPLKEGDSVKQCERTQKTILQPPIGPIGLLRAKRQLAVAPVAMALPFRSPQISDTCPENFYCLVYEQQFPNSNGHCCPKPKSACPVGEPDPNAKCNGFEIGGAARQQCNFHTHYCFQPGVVGSIGEQICCPKPCTANAIYKDGRCYGRSRIGDDCEINEQCGNGNEAYCGDGKCKCAKGWLARNGFCMQPSCGILRPVPMMMPMEAQAPITNENGEIKECASSAECGNGYCVVGQNICCPKPAPNCPGLPNDLKPKSCNPLMGNNDCGENQYCYRYMNAVESANSDMGAICCQKAMPVPFPRPIG